MIKKAAIFSLCICLLTACAQNPDLPDQYSNTEKPQITNPENVLDNTAIVDSIEILILESFPVQVNVAIKGSLRNGCERIDQIFKEYVEDDFKITLITTQDQDAICTQALVPFEQTIGLDVLGLEAGIYNVDVNGIASTFTLQIDNNPIQ